MLHMPPLDGHRDGQIDVSTADDPCPVRRKVPEMGGLSDPGTLLANLPKIGSQNPSLKRSKKETANRSQTIVLKSLQGPGKGPDGAFLNFL